MRHGQGSSCRPSTRSSPLLQTTFQGSLNIERRPTYRMTANGLSRLQFCQLAGLPSLPLRASRCNVKKKGTTMPSHHERKHPRQAHTVPPRLT